MVLTEANISSIDVLQGQLVAHMMGFILCNNGSITLSMDGRSYTVRKGDLCIWPAFTSAAIEGVSADFEALVGIGDFNQVMSSVNNVSNTQNHVFIRFHPLITLSDAQTRRIKDIAAILLCRMKAHTVLSVHVEAALAQALICEILDAYNTNYDVTSSYAQSRNDKVFQTFLVNLYDNFRTHRDVSFYAGLQCLTPRYFTTIIRETSGRTPMRWITSFVIIEAKHLFGDPNLSIKEISEQLNFPNQSFFGRYFRQYAGQSPTSYRRSITTATH